MACIAELSFFVVDFQLFFLCFFLVVDVFEQQAFCQFQTQMTRIRGGEVSPAGVVRVNFYPNGSTSGVDVVIDDRDTPADQGFLVSLDPLIGLVTIQDEPQR